MTVGLWPVGVYGVALSPPASGAGPLVGASTTQDATSGTGAIVQRHKPAGAPTSQAATSGTGAAVQRHLLAGAGSAQSAASLAAAVIQRHLLAGANSSQANESTVGGVVSGGGLLGAPTSQSATSGTGAVVQRHKTTGVGSSQGASSGTGAVVTTGGLQGAPSTQTAQSQAGAIATRHILAGAGSSQSASSPGGALGGPEIPDTPAVRRIAIPARQSTVTVPARVGRISIIAANAAAAQNGRNMTPIEMHRGAELDWLFDWRSRWLLAGESIATHTVEITGPIDLLDDLADGDVGVAWVRMQPGAARGAQATVISRIVTDNVPPRKEHWELRLQAA